jgi:hypothetical protein
MSGVGWARESVDATATPGAEFGIGESCQFQNLVRSIFSLALERPRIASANVPDVGRSISSTSSAPLRRVCSVHSASSPAYGGIGDSADHGAKPKKGSCFTFYLDEA